MLEMAGADGLNPDDYSASALVQALNHATQAAQAAQPALAPERQAELAGTLTQAVEHFVSDLHSGRVAPRDVHAAFAPAAKLLDPPTLVREAVASHRLTAAVRAAELAGLAADEDRDRAGGERAVEQPDEPLALLERAHEPAQAADVGAVLR